MVVLPQPDSPTSASISPGSTLKLDALDRMHLQLLAAHERPGQAAGDRIARDQPLDLEQGRLAAARRDRLGAHGDTAAGTSFRWQAAICASPTARSRGSWSTHRANAESQRGWNAQPGTGRSSRGGTPGIDFTSSSP